MRIIRNAREYLSILFLLLVCVSLAQAPVARIQTTCLSKIVCHVPEIVPSRSVKPTEYIMEATAYNTGRITCTGKQVHYGIVAADLKILSLGSIIDIVDIGQFEVGDCGPAIVGNKLDIYMKASYGECIKFGRRKVRVIVLRRGY